MLLLYYQITSNIQIIQSYQLIHVFSMCIGRKSVRRHHHELNGVGLHVLLTMVCHNIVIFAAKI